MTSKELDSILRVMKRYNAISFKSGEIEIKIMPTNEPISMQNADAVGKSSEKVTDEDLYYSASTLKPRIK